MPKLLLVLIMTVIATGLMLRPEGVWAASATLYLSPDSQTISEGDSFTLAIYTDTGTEEVNAVQANITYPADKLQFVAIDETGSDFNVPVNPVVSNGKIEIARGSMSPQKGTLLVSKVTFKALMSSGSASLSFIVEADSESAVVRASDNKNILSSVTGGTYNFKVPASGGDGSSNGTNNTSAGGPTGGSGGGSSTGGATPSAQQEPAGQEKNELSAGMNGDTSVAPVIPSDSSTTSDSSSGVFVAVASACLALFVGGAILAWRKRKLLSIKPLNVILPTPPGSSNRPKVSPGSAGPPAHVIYPENLNKNNRKRKDQ